MFDKTPTQRRVGLVLITALLFTTVAPGSAFAGIVGTGSAIAEHSSMMNRDALIEELNRADVRDQLEHMGVSADEAIERVAAMTDAEVLALADGINDLPAGADVGVGLAILVVLILILVMR